MMRIAITLTGVLTLALLNGCAQSPRMYDWGTYESQVYAHLKNTGSPEQQIAELEKTLQINGGQRVPPGFHAHLGLLYGETGRVGDMKKQFQLEKTLFPEATPFMDFLLNRANQQAVKK